MDKIKVVVLSPEDTKYELKTKLTHEDIAFLGFAKPGDAAMEKVLSFLPDAVVIVSDGSDALHLAKQIYVALPGCAILLMDDKIDLPSVERAMLSGVRKVLPLQCGQSQLIDSIKIACMMEKSRIRRNDNQIVGGTSKIITVLGSKGGIGKSTIVSNISVCLARMGKRVAVLDLDLQLGDINLFFDVDPKDTIAELVQEEQSPDIDTIKSYMQLHSSSVSLLCAPKSPEMAEIIRGENVEKIINILRPYFDYILIDTPTYLSDISIVAVENADEVLQIITLDISTLRNTKIILDIFESLQQKDKFSVIINRDTKGLISQKDAQQILDCPIKFKISCDWKTAFASLNRGVPIVTDSPRSAIAREIIALTNLVTGKTEGRAKKKKAGKK